MDLNSQQEEITQLAMYGLIRNDHNTVRIANRIFETMLYNLFLSDEELKSSVFYYIEAQTRDQTRTEQM